MTITDYPTLNHCRECGELGPHELNIGDDTRFWLCDGHLNTLRLLTVSRAEEYAKAEYANQLMQDAGLSMLDQAMQR